MTGDEGQADDPPGAWPGAGTPTTRLLYAGPTQSLVLKAIAGSETAIWFTHLKTRERWWSEHMFALHGLPASGPVPADYMELVLPEDRVVVEQGFRDSVISGSHCVEYRVRWPDGSVHWLEGRGSVRHVDGQATEITGVCQLIDARKREESDLAFLASASLEFARTIDYEETLRRIAAMAVPRFADWCAVDMLDDEGRLRRVAVAHVDPAKVELARRLYEQYPPAEDAGTGIWQVLRSGQPELVPDITDDMLVRGAADAGHLAILRSLGLRAYMGVPIGVQDGTRGVISFVSAESGRRYEPRDLDLALNLASRAGLAIRNATLFQQLGRSQRRQDFLLRLTDVLRADAATQAVLERVSALLGEHFGVDRVGYGHVDEHLDRIDYDVCWTRDDSVPPLRGRFPASAFGPQVIARLRAGRSVVIANVRAHALTAEAATQQTSHEVDTRAILVVPLFKQGQLRTIVYLNQREQRHWTVEEAELMEEVAERTRELIERGRTEAALRASEARWRGLFERMNEGFFVGEAIRDSRGRMADFWFLQANPAFEKLTGVATVSAIGRTATEAIPGVPQTLIDTCARVVDSGEPAEFEVNVPALGGRWFEARAMRLAPEQFSVLFVDITERRRVQDELVQREAQLREADSRKNEFLATLAHELRNPLAPLRNGLMILRSPKAAEAAGVRALELMERQLNQLVRLVDDLLDVSRVSLGKVTMKKSLTSLQAVVETALETSRPLIEASGHSLSVELPDEPVPLNVDPTRIAQVLSNLLNNAAKYTPVAGRIRLGAFVQPEVLRIEVQDNGLGIPAHMLEDVFELFTQVGGALERSQGGLGIGLNLAKRLVELHDGRIRADSPGEGQGSTFTVELPLAPAPAAEQAPAKEDRAASGPARRRILVVDDNVDAAESLQMLLSLSGHEVHLAHTGSDAIAAVARVSPELVFLDIGLPDINGHEVARRLRAQPGGAALLLVALTGWGSQADQRLARDAGVDLHLTKPVGPLELERALAHRRG